MKKQTTTSGMAGEISTYVMRGNRTAQDLQKHFRLTAKAAKAIIAKAGPTLGTKGADNEAYMKAVGAILKGGNVFEAVSPQSVAAGALGALSRSRDAIVQHVNESDAGTMMQQRASATLKMSRMGRQIAGGMSHSKAVSVLSEAGWSPAKIEDQLKRAGHHTADVERWMGAALNEAKAEAKGKGTVRVTVKKFKGEWAAVYYLDGKFQEGPTYYAGESPADKQDAMGTAKMMRAQAKKDGYTVQEDALDEGDVSEAALSAKDKAVIVAFTEKKPMEGRKLSTDGTRLDFNGMGGRGVAEWSNSKIYFGDTGSAQDDMVQRAIRKEAPRNWIGESTEVEEGMAPGDQLKALFDVTKSLSTGKGKGAEGSVKSALMGKAARLGITLNKIPGYKELIAPTIKAAQSGKTWAQARKAMPGKSLGESVEEPVVEATITAAAALSQMKAGDRVVLSTPQGQTVSGKAVMRGPYGWAVNLGGRHGTPGVATEANLVKWKGKAVVNESGPTPPRGPKSVVEGVMSLQDQAHARELGIDEGKALGDKRMSEYMRLMLSASQAGRAMMDARSKTNRLGGKTDDDVRDIMGALRGLNTQTPWKAASAVATRYLAKARKAQKAVKGTPLESPLQMAITAMTSMDEARRSGDSAKKAEKPCPECRGRGWETPPGGMRSMIPCHKCHGTGLKTGKLSHAETVKRIHAAMATGKYESLDEAQPKPVTLSMADQVDMNTGPKGGGITPAIHAWASKKYGKGNGVSITNAAIAKQRGSMSIDAPKGKHVEISVRGKYVIVKTEGKKAAFFELNEANDDKTDDLPAKAEAGLKAKAKEMGATSVTGKGPSVNATFDSKEKAAAFFKHAKTVGKAAMRRSGDTEFTVHIDEDVSVDEDEKTIAKKMQAKGYRFIIEFPGGKPAPLYAKTLAQSVKIIKDNGAPKGVKGQPIDKFLGESEDIDEGDLKIRGIKVPAQLVMDLSAGGHGRMARAEKWLAELGVTRSEVIAAKKKAKNESEECPEIIDIGDGRFYIEGIGMCETREEAEGHLLLAEDDLDEMRKSKGHVAFLGDFEYVIVDGGSDGMVLGRAPTTNAFDTSGNRHARFEAPSWQAEQAMKLAFNGFQEKVDPKAMQRLKKLLKEDTSEAELIEAEGKANKTDPEIIAALRKIVRDHQYAKVKDSTGKSMNVDATSANAIVAVFDALSTGNRKKYITVPLPRMASMAFKMLKQESTDEGPAPLTVAIKDIFDNGEHNHPRYTVNVETNNRDSYTFGMFEPGSEPDTPVGDAVVSNFTNFIKGAARRGEAQEKISMKQLPDSLSGQLETLVSDPSRWQPDLEYDEGLEEFTSASIPAIGTMHPWVSPYGSEMSLIGSADDLEDDENADAADQLDESVKPTIEGFHFILTGALTQWDQQQMTRAAKSARGYYNPNAMGLYLQGVERAEKDKGMRGVKKTSSAPEDLRKLIAVLSYHFEANFPPVKKTIKQINAYLDSGKLPKYPTVPKKRNKISDSIEDIEDCPEIDEAFGWIWEHVGIDEASNAYDLLMSADKDLVRVLVVGVKKIKAAIKKAQVGQRNMEKIGVGKTTGKDQLGPIIRELQAYEKFVSGVIKQAQTAESIDEAGDGGMLDEGTSLHDALVSFFAANPGRAYTASNIAKLQSVAVSASMKTLSTMVREGTLQFQRGEGYSLRGGKGIRIPGALPHKRPARVTNQMTHEDAEATFDYDEELDEGKKTLTADDFSKGDAGGNGPVNYEPLEGEDDDADETTTSGGVGGFSREAIGGYPEHKGREGGIRDDSKKKKGKRSDFSNGAIGRVLEQMRESMPGKTDEELIELLDLDEQSWMPPAGGMDLTRKSPIHDKMPPQAYVVMRGKRMLYMTNRARAAKNWAQLAGSDTQVVKNPPGWKRQWAQLGDLLSEAELDERTYKTIEVFSSNTMNKGPWIVSDPYGNEWKHATKEEAMQAAHDMAAVENWDVNLTGMGVQQESVADNKRPVKLGPLEKEVMRVTRAFGTQKFTAAECQAASNALNKLSTAEIGGAIDQLIRKGMLAGANDYFSILGEDETDEATREAIYGARDKKEKATKRKAKSKAAERKMWDDHAKAATKKRNEDTDEDDTDEAMKASARDSHDDIMDRLENSGMDMEKAEQESELLYFNAIAVEIAKALKGRVGRTKVSPGGLIVDIKTPRGRPWQLYADGDMDGQFLKLEAPGAPKIQVQRFGANQMHRPAGKVANFLLAQARKDGVMEADEEDLGEREPLQFPESALEKYVLAAQAAGINEDDPCFVFENGTFTVEVPAEIAPRLRELVGV